MSLQVEESMVGQNVNCPGCSERIHVPRAAAAEAEPSKGERGGWPETDPSNVSVWLSLLLGMVAMAATVGILHLVRASAMAEIFFSGGWVTYVELLIFFWGLGIVLLKNRKNRRQRDALLLEVLPTSVGAQIKADNVHRFIAHLYGLPQHLRDSMMINRIRKGLELFEARTNNSEVATIMNAQSNVDANRIAGSYALLKVFLWALPILGFVGTVLGLSEAMASFGSTDLADINALKGAVGSITGGLASAFNTTLVGLALSMLLIFPMSAMQKREEDCLTDIDAFCNEKVLARLNDGAAVATQTPLARGETGEFAALLGELAGLQKQFVADLRGVAESMQDVTAVVQVAAKQLGERATRHQQHVEEKFAAALDEIVAKSGGTLNKHVAAIATGIESLNKVLAALGEKKIVVQRRGWFSRRNH